MSKGVVLMEELVWRSEGSSTMGSMCGRSWRGWKWCEGCDGRGAEGGWSGADGAGRGAGGRVVRSDSSLITVVGEEKRNSSSECWLTDGTKDDALSSSRNPRSAASMVS